MLLFSMSKPKYGRLFVPQKQTSKQTNPKQNKKPHTFLKLLLEFPT